MAQNSGSKGRERHSWLDDDEATRGRRQVRREDDNVGWLARRHGGCSARCLLREKTAAPVGGEDFGAEVARILGWGLGIWE